MDAFVLRSLLIELRKDPDVVVLGELFDETSAVVYTWAQLVVPASLVRPVLLGTYDRLWRNAAWYPVGGEPTGWLWIHAIDAVRAARAEVA